MLEFGDEGEQVPLMPPVEPTIPDTEGVAVLKKAALNPAKVTDPPLNGSR